MKIETKNAEQLAKRMLYLAYEASTVQGMGAFQATESATEEEVWNNSRTAGDYPGEPRHDINSQVNADYLFGRMMKFHVKFDETSLELPEGRITPDYQAWCTKYKTYKKLADAAAESLGEEL